MIGPSNGDAPGAHGRSGPGPRSRAAPAAAPSPEALAALDAAPRGFVAGLAGFARGAGFVIGRPRLWPWVAMPLAVNLALFIGLTVVAWRGLSPLLPDFDAQDWGLFDGLRIVVGPTLDVLLALALLVASFAVTLLLAGVVNAPFHDVLSERVEKAALGRRLDERPWSAFLPDLLRATSAALRIALSQALVLIPLFALSFTAVGAPLFVAAGCWFAGFALADVTLGRWRLRARERGLWARRRWALMLGLGLPVQLLPPLQPFGVAGATLLCLPRRATQDPSPTPGTAAAPPPGPGAPR